MKKNKDYRNDYEKLVHRTSWKKIFKKYQAFYLEMLDVYKSSIFDFGRECLFDYALKSIKDFDGNFEKSWINIPNPDLNYKNIGDRNEFISEYAFDLWANSVMFFDFNENSNLHLPMKLCEELNNIYSDEVEEHASDDYKEFFNLKDKDKK